MTQPTIPSRVPACATPEGDGIIVGGGLVRVDAYIDFLCPFCLQFELSGDTLADLVSGGQASIAYHPMNFLDEASTTGYSTRAAAASGCAADQDRFTEFAHALFVHQPPEGGPGLERRRAGRDRPGGRADQPGVHRLPGGQAVSGLALVRDGARLAAAGVSGTPTVLVAGQDVPANRTRSAPR